MRERSPEVSGNGFGGRRSLFFWLGEIQFLISKTKIREILCDFAKLGPIRRSETDLSWVVSSFNNVWDPVLGGSPKWAMRFQLHYRNFPNKIIIIIIFLFFFLV